MHPVAHPRALIPVVLTALLATVSGPADAQNRSGCRPTGHVSVGGLIGGSISQFELTQPAIEVRPLEIVSVRQTGRVRGVRGDVSLAGSVRARVEWTDASWGVERFVYASQAGTLQQVEMRSDGQVRRRGTMAQIGWQRALGRVCGYAMVGGGIQTVSYADSGDRIGQLALTAGLEIPAWTRGAVELDLHFNSIAPGNHLGVVSHTPVLLGTSMGWVFRF